MKIGIIGAGNVGTGLGKHLAAKGHDLVLSFSREPEKLVAAAAMVGGGARSGSVAEAIDHGDVVIIATPWTVTLGTIAPWADALAGKIVWDTTNALKPDMTGLAIGTTTSAGEEIAKLLPSAQVVKAIAPFAELLHSASNLIDGHKPQVFVAGDNEGARKTILGLVGDIDADGVDAGPLSLARYVEPLGMLLVQLAFMQGFGSRIGTILVRD